MPNDNIILQGREISTNESKKEKNQQPKFLSNNLFIPISLLCSKLPCTVKAMKGDVKPFFLI